MIATELMKETVLSAIERRHGSVDKSILSRVMDENLDSVCSMVDKMVKIIKQYELIKIGTIGRGSK